MHDSLDLGLLKSQIIMDKKGARRTWIAFFVLVAIIVIIMLFLIGLYFPASNTNAQTCMRCVSVLITLAQAVVLTIVIVGALVVFYINWRRRRNRAKTIQNSAPSLNLPTVVSSHINIVSIIWFLGLIASAFILKLKFIDGFMLVVILSLLPFLVISFLGIWMRVPLFNAEYNETIHRAHVFERLLKGNPGILVGESLALIFAGKTTESEKLHLQFIAQAQRAKSLDWLAYNNYGVELTYQRRYAEALPLLEFAILLQPHIPDSYKSLANWYLFQNTASDRALELAKFALQLQPTPIAGIKENSKSLWLATQAWAEARTGQNKAAKTSLAQGLKIASPKYVPMFAELQRIAGETNLALGDLSAARDYFQKAVHLDLNGRIGKLAQQALDKIS